MGFLTLQEAVLDAIGLQATLVTVGIFSVRVHALGAHRSALGMTNVGSWTRVSVIVTQPLEAGVEEEGAKALLEQAAGAMVLWNSWYPSGKERDAVALLPILPLSLQASPAQDWAPLALPYIGRACM